MEGGRAGGDSAARAGWRGRWPATTPAVRRQPRARWPAASRRRASRRAAIPAAAQASGQVSGGFVELRRRLYSSASGGRTAAWLRRRRAWETFEEHALCTNEAFAGRLCWCGTALRARARARWRVSCRWSVGAARTGGAAARTGQAAALRGVEARATAESFALLLPVLRAAGAGGDAPFPLAAGAARGHAPSASARSTDSSRAPLANAPETHSCVCVCSQWRCALRWRIGSSSQNRSVPAAHQELTSRRNRRRRFSCRIAKVPGGGE